MIAMYGRARVGQAVVALAKTADLDIEIFDDVDPVWSAADYEIVIPTPGLPPSNRAYGGNNRVSELDFAASLLPEGFKIIAVTGTDGKSTVAWMLYGVLKQIFGVEHVYLSGNFEIPLSETVTNILHSGVKSGYIVVEVSSFMSHELGTNLPLLSIAIDKESKGFHPDITLFTNFAPDHLDWHGSLSAYFKAKMQLISVTKWLVIAGENLNEFTLNHREKFPENTRFFGNTKSYNSWTDGEIVHTNSGGKYLLSKTQFRGIHNALNILAAIEALESLGLCHKDITGALPALSVLPHRLEYIGSRNGVRYIDDSKSTSAQSLAAALWSFSSCEVVLIAWGYDKGDSFDHLLPLIKKHVTHIICIGATAPIFMDIARSAGKSATLAKSMLEAVEFARSHARVGDTILLSPGCASFGMFRNYLDRAEQFHTAFDKIPCDEA